MPAANGRGSCGNNGGASNSNSGPGTGVINASGLPQYGLTDTHWDQTGVIFTGPKR